MNISSNEKEAGSVGMDSEMRFWNRVLPYYIPTMTIALFIAVCLVGVTLRAEAIQMHRKKFLEKLEFVRDQNTGLCYAKYQGSLALVPEGTIHVSIRSVTLEGMEYIKDPVSGLCFAKHRDVITVVPEEKVKHLLILPKEEKK